MKHLGVKILYKLKKRASFVTFLLPADVLQEVVGIVVVMKPLLLII